ncbi:F0F1 ATP synthase subunit B family protein [Nostoc sp.]|uniref:F0F1 ATP synthase subunit B family protein n=1 Tax=Nostoc sp. TaxID=1180 RepID=UPI002FF9D31E
MEINWFTFGAQILNFFVLIFVLQRFLYKPITKAMARREKTISDRLSSASEQKEEAEQEVKHYQEIQQQFTDEKAELLTQAKSEVEETRQRLLKEMHESVAKERSQWQSNLQRQKDSFLHEVGDRTMEQLQATVRRVLTDLAQSELETQIARVFLQKLRDLTETERAELVTTLTASTKDSIPLTVVSTFTLPTDICAAIATVLQDYFNAGGSEKIEPIYEIESSLICGIELRGTGYKLAWSMDAYLDTITENLVTVFAAEAETNQNSPNFRF